ncbi:MAG: hypothetical protein IJU07_01770 [Synergistaceae bacterium]|nr:hypothetical protein [Synergistaceae bacterium]
MDIEILLDVFGATFTVKGGRFAMGMILTLRTAAIWPCVIKLTGGNNK